MSRRAMFPLTGLIAAGATGVAVLAAIHPSPAPAASRHAAASMPTLSVGHADPQRGPAKTVSRILLGGNGHWYDQNFGGWDPRTQRMYPGFAAAERRAGVTQQRYPSGTAANLFDWEDAIGPVARRPRQVGYSNGTYTAPTDDDFGLDEWARYSEQMDQPGDVMVNATTQTPAQAGAEVQYLTGGVDGHLTFDGRNWAAVRAANGHRAPYPHIPFWEVGNEMGLSNQLYWRAGTPVNGHGQVLTNVDPTELYTFGGSTRLTDQPVGTVHDFRPSASLSTGAPDQHRYAEYPPVADFGAVTVQVAGDPAPWTPVASLQDQGPDAQVFTLDRATGEITFGDGTHGAIPAAHAAITVSYTSGPHGGFVDDYREMKRANPHIEVCAGLSDEAATLEFIRLMAARHDRYDCVVDHAYISAAGEGFSTSGSVESFYEHVIDSEPTQIGVVRTFEAAIAAHGVDPRRVGVAITEYGNNGAPPAADPDFGGSIGQAVLMGDDLIAWSRLGIPEADKSNLNGFAKGAQPADPKLYPVDATMLSKTSLIQRTRSGRFTLSATGLVSGLFTPFAGGTPTAVPIADNRPFPGDARLGDLDAFASRHASGPTDILIVNRDPTSPVTARLRLPTGTGDIVRMTTIKAPTLTSMSPGGVTEASHDATATRGVVTQSFPAHSVTRIEVSPL